MPAQPYPSKITQPQTRQVLLRENLLSELKQQQSFSPLIWISAAGGSGKTTLINSYLKQYNKRNIWYQIDDGDSDPATIFHYLKMAAKKLSPKSKKTLPSLSAEHMPGLTNFTRQFTDSLATILKSDGVIVFDNLHLLDDDSIFYTLLPVMIECLHSGQSIIIISRQEPPNSLIGLQASQKMSHINEKSLRFDEDEWCSLASLLGQDTVDKKTLLQLHKRANGWIAGLLLGQLQRDYSVDQDKALSASSFAYFAEEILNKQSVEHQHCLLKLSYLPYISQSSALTLGNDSEVMTLINEMSSKNQFITPYEGDQFIFHPLFQEFLQQEFVKQFPGNEVNNILLQTAELLEQDENYFSAISLYYNAGHDDKAIALICQQSSAIIASGQFAQLSQALAKIPDHTKNTNAQLCFINATLFSMGNPESAIEHFVRASDLFVAENNITAAYEALLSAIKQINNTLHCFKQLTSLLEKFSALQAQHPIPDKLSQKDLISILMTAYFITDYDRPQMNYWISRCEQEIELNADPAQTAELTLALLLIYFNEANSEKIVKTIDFILPFISKDHLPPFIFIASHFSIIFSWLHVMDIEKGHELTLSLIKFAKESEIVALDSFLLIAEAKFELFMGRFDSVKECLDKLYPLCRGDRNYLSNYYYLQSQYYLWQDDYEQALKNLELSKQAIGEGNLFAWRIVLDDMHAELLFLDGDYEKCTEFNQQTLKQVDGFPNHGVFAHALMLEALLADKNGEPDQAHTALSKAIKHINEHKLSRFSNWYPTFISQVAQFSFRHNIETDLMKSWIAKHIDYLPAPSLSLTQWPWPIKIHTLGQFNVLVDGRDIFAETRRDAKPVQLLKSIIKHAGEVSITTLYDELYPELSADKQQSSLHTHLHRLRQLLGADEALLRESEKLRLNPKYVWSDDKAFTALLSNHAEQSDVTMQQALQLYKGEYLSAEDDFDVLTRREYLRSQYLNAITEQIKSLIVSQPQQAIELCHQAIKVEALSETLYQLLIQIYLEQGRRDLATTTYEQCRRTLQSYLQIEPCPTTTALLSS